MKTKRGLSGVYYRVKVDDGKFENRVFEDLSASQQDEILNKYKVGELRGLAKILANTLNTIGEQFDLTSE